jgi:hypothetical protein
MSTTNIDRYDLSTAGANYREDLANVIYNISPTETPLTMRAGRETASEVLTEWLIDELSAVDTANAFIDGADFGTDSSDTANRIGVFHQISRKDIRVSRRADLVSKAGRKSEIAYQIAKKGKALKRDVEAIACANQATLAGTASVASLSAGLGAWIRTNTNRGAGGADPALSSTTFGQPTTAATDGTVRALSFATLQTGIKNAWVAGGEPDMVMVGPTVKQLLTDFLFSTDARIASPYQDYGRNPPEGANVLSAIDILSSNYGRLDIVPNRFQRERDVWILDSEYWALSYLDAYRTEELAKVGDSETRMLLVDWALKSKQEAASAVVADINTATAVIA